MDLVDDWRVDEIRSVVRSLNDAAAVVQTRRSVVDPGLVVDQRAFDVDRVLVDVDPTFLDRAAPGDPAGPLPRWHDPSLTSVDVTVDAAVNVTLLHAWIQQLFRILPKDRTLLRYKGILHVKGADAKYVFQGVHRSSHGGFDLENRWLPGEPRLSKFTFIGHYLDKQLLTRGFKAWTDERKPVAVVG